MKLTVVLEDGNTVIAKEEDGQLYIGLMKSLGNYSDPKEARVFKPISAYSLLFNGGEKLESYTDAGGRQVKLEPHKPLEEN